MLVFVKLFTEKATLSQIGQWTKMGKFLHFLTIIKYEDRERMDENSRIN